MSSLPSTLPNTVAELQQLLIEQQRINQEQAAALKSSQALNKALEQKLRLLNQKHFAKSSEKNPGQAELQFLEALLPWNITPEEVDRRYATYPVP